MQQIDEIFKLVATGDGRSAWRLVPRRPIRTTDGKMYTSTGDHQVGRARDTVLSPPTPAENAEWSRRMATMSGYDGGLLWQGDLKPVGDAVAAVTDALRRVKGGTNRQKDALSKAVCAIANYGNHLETSEADQGPAGALAFGGNDEMNGGREEDVSGHAISSDAKPRFSKASVGDSGGAQMRKWRDQTGNEVAAMQRAINEFWARQRKG